MAQITLQARAFRGAPKSTSNAKNIADLIVAKSTNEAGKVTNPEVYQTAIELLKGGREVEELDIDIQKKIAGYENDFKSLNNKKANAKRSVDDFRRLQDSIQFNDLDVEFRNPFTLLESTILENDRILLEVLDAIESKSANDEDVESLQNYANELGQTIDDLDDFRRQVVNQEFTPGKKTFDTFTYVLNSDPDGQGIKGATIIPTRLLPKGYQRTNESFSLNGAYIPVAIPTVVDKKGKVYGSIGGQIYKASDSKNPLRYRSDKPGVFDLSNQTTYSKKPSGISKGVYVQGTVDYDEDGNPITGILKRGDDGKLYSIDSDTFEQLKTNPFESQKLEGYIETLNAKDFNDAYNKSEPLKYKPLEAGRAETFNRYQEEATQAQAEADRLQNMGFFSKFRESAERGRTRVNRQTPPREPVISESTPDIIEQGKTFFQKAKEGVSGFFSQRT